MKITNVGQVMNVYNKSKVKSVSKTEQSNSIKDSVNISNAAKEFQVGLRAALNVPDIRKDKVDEIKNRVSSGTYNVSSKEVSDKMVDSFFDTIV